MSTRDPGFGVYIHWPFCAQKCPYCDFNSHVRHKGWDEPRFLAAYRRELDHVAGIVGRDTAVSSIFLGGGTPSLMQPSTVAGLLDHIASLWPVAPRAEITLEANPGSVEAGRFAGYRSAGVNRVSLGVQSLSDAELRRLGRIHTVEEAKAALAIASKSFERFSFDLIYARPGQTLESWRDELAQALAMAGDHLSLYQLTIEPDTPFAALHKSGKLVTPAPESARALYDLTQEMTEAAGLPAYEISNHARMGEESRHNMLYWRYGAYAGIGAGAHGRLVRHDDNARIATHTARDPEGWLAAVETKGHGMVDLTPLTQPEEADEMLLMGLRITEGLDLARLEVTTGLQIAAETICALEADGLVELHRRQARLAATREGRLVLDWVVSRLSHSLRRSSPRHLPAA